MFVCSNVKINKILYKLPVKTKINLVIKFSKCPVKITKSINIGGSARTNINLRSNAIKLNFSLTFINFEQFIKDASTECSVVSIIQDILRIPEVLLVRHKESKEWKARNNTRTHSRRKRIDPRLILASMTVVFFRGNRTSLSLFKSRSNYP